MMRILLLTHYFPPEVGAPQVRLGALVSNLAARGAQMTVHAPPPHYPDGAIRSPYRNRALSRSRLPDGTRLLRSAVWATPNRGVLRRLANHASFGASALATSWASGRQSVLITESPPLFTAVAGALYARSKRAPLVLNVADRWPASAIELGVLTDGRAIALAEALERWCYRHATAIVVPTHGMRDALEALPEAAGKVAVIPPGVDLERFDPRPASAAGGPLRVLYAGTLGLAQGLQTLVEAARLAGPKVVEVTIVGDGAEVEALRAARCANVRVLPAVSAAAVPRLYAEADAGVVLLRDLPIFDEALPTKLLEVMAAGRTVIAALRGDAARLIGQRGAGIVVAPEDPGALAQAFRRLAADRDLVRRSGRAARACAQHEFGRAEAIARWEGLLRPYASTSQTA